MLIADVCRVCRVCRVCHWPTRAPSGRWWAGTAPVGEAAFTFPADVSTKSIMIYAALFLENSGAALLPFGACHLLVSHAHPAAQLPARMGPARVCCACRPGPSACLALRCQREAGKLPVNGMKQGTRGKASTPNE